MSEVPSGNHDDGAGPPKDWRQGDPAGGSTGSEQLDFDACLAGEAVAWERFVRRQAPLLAAVITRTLGAHGVSRLDVDDLLQDLFLRLWADDRRLLRRYHPGRARLATWLAVVARNHAIDVLRARRLPTLPLECHHAIADSAGEVESAADDLPELPAGLLEGLLSSRQLLVLRLLYDQGATVAETARLLGIEEQTVRSCRHKALERLRAHLGVPDGRRPGDAGDGLSV